MPPLHSMSPRSKEIYEGTYQRLDSLEETIHELEMAISEISSHPAAGFLFPKGLLGQAAPDGSEEMKARAGHLEHSGCDAGTALDLSQPKGDAPESSPPSQTKPPLLPKPQLPLSSPQVYFLFSLLVCSALGFTLMSSLPPPLPAPSL